MSEFRTIEIDFDVHKVIEGERRNFGESPNDVLRRLFQLPQNTPPSADKKVINGTRSWSGDGVTLPHGTFLKMKYNGRQHQGEIVDGKWIIDGHEFESPSGAASGVAITKNGKKTRLDGWIYWEVRLVGENQWTPLRSLRPDYKPLNAILRGHE
jgi:hypothetical protein